MLAVRTVHSPWSGLAELSLEQVSEFEMLMMVQCPVKPCMEEPGAWNPAGGSRKTSNRKC